MTRRQCSWRGAISSDFPARNRCGCFGRVNESHFSPISPAARFGPRADAATSLPTENLHASLDCCRRRFICYLASLHLTSRHRSVIRCLLWWIEARIIGRHKSSLECFTERRTHCIHERWKWRCVDKRAQHCNPAGRIRILSDIHNQFVLVYGNSTIATESISFRQWDNANSVRRSAGHIRRHGCTRRSTAVGAEGSTGNPPFELCRFQRRNSHLMVKQTSIIMQEHYPFLGSKKRSTSCCLTVPKASEEITLQLVRTKCMPTVLYGLECFSVAKADIKSLNLLLLDS